MQFLWVFLFWKLLWHICLVQIPFWCHHWTFYGVKQFLLFIINFVIIIIIIISTMLVCTSTDITKLIRWAWGGYGEPTIFTWLTMFFLECVLFQEAQLFAFLWYQFSQESCWRICQVLSWLVQELQIRQGLSKFSCPTSRWSQFLDLCTVKVFLLLLLRHFILMVQSYRSSSTVFVLCISQWFQACLPWFHISVYWHVP